MTSLNDKAVSVSIDTNRGSNDGRTRRRSAQKTETLPRTADAFLDAASALMIDRNSINISFADIAEKAQLNPALIYYHFKTKVRLLTALIERDAGGTYSELSKLVESDMPATAKMRRHIHGVLKVYQRFPYLNRLVSNLASDTDSKIAQNISESFSAPLIEAQTRILEQGEKEGVFRKIDPMMLYFSLFGACDHLFSATYALRWNFEISVVDDDLRKRYANHVSDMILRDLAP